MKANFPKDSSGAAKISKSRFPHQIFIESYGVTVRFACNSIDGIEAVKEMLPNVLAGKHRLVPPIGTDHSFYYAWNKSGRDSLYKNNERVLVRIGREQLLDQLDSHIRLTVAEFAVERVFVHAGVVCWKGAAIVMPAKSFEGKSTLTAELVRRGAVYYSDEYAIIDKHGFVSPFPKMLSIRGEMDEFRQSHHPVEEFGGVAGTAPIPIAMILLTGYKAKSKWKPQIMNNAAGVMEILRDTISIRHDPVFTLSVLNIVAKNCVIVRSRRGEAREFVDEILNFFDSKCLRK